MLSLAARFAAVPLLLFLLPGPAQERSAARLELEGLDGSTRLVPVAGFRTEDPREVGAYLIRPLGLTPPAGEAPAAPKARIELAGGDQLRGRILGGDGEVLSVELAGSVSLPIDISNLRSFVVPHLLPETLEAAPVAKAEGDRLYLRVGQSLDKRDGTVEAFTAEGVRFDGNLLGSKLIPWGSVAALFVEVLDEGGSEQERAGVPVVVDLADQSRVRGRLLGIAEATCELAVAGTDAISLSFDHVAEIAVDDGSLAFLSDMTPAGEEGRGVPFGDDLGMVWPHKIDRSVVDGPLVSGGRRYTRGVGTHAPTRVTWRIDGGWTELRGAVAIDDSVLVLGEAARGSVVFRIHVDGELAWESGVVRGGDAPKPIPALKWEARAEERTLVLEADAAGDFRGDRANWLRILFVR